ncbi:MAG: nucleoside:proton symporter [Alphaproteobacteria bacterium]|nr:nucleoside:proton symporter [Alphaproteobacteria bacterium]MDE2630896.1 nucleoside:proton symporter [Alphaproteobacteria bacterium]
MFPHLQSLLGIFVILTVAWILSENRRAFPLRTVVSGLALQIGLALLLLKVPVARDALYGLNGVVGALTGATRAGTSFVFGVLGGADPPFAVTNPKGMVNFAFGILPLVIVISALSALLWHWKILPVIVKAIAFVLRKLLGVGGAVGLGGGSMVFLGNVEGLLVIRPYLARLTRAEMFILFTVGMAVVSGTVFVLYAMILKEVLPGALGHVLVASFLSLVSAIVIGRIIVPTEAGIDAVDAAGSRYHSSMDSIAHGTEEGLKLYWQIIAMLVVVVALVALLNVILAVLPPIFGAPLTLQRIFGWLFAPVVWLIGVPWRESATAGSLLGLKTSLNEVIAYLSMAALPKGALDPRSMLIMVYALCGFANFSSVGILIAGTSALVPERRDEIVPLALRALVSGTMASCMTGAVIGLLPVV